MSICNSFLAIHESVMNWSLFLYHGTRLGKKVLYSDAVPKTSAESLLLLLLHCLWKNQRNTDSSGLSPSHLKFVSDFSKKKIFGAGTPHQQHCNTPNIAPVQKLFVRVRFELKISWTYSVLDNFLKLWTIILVMTRCSFSGLNMCPMGTRLEIMQISTNQLLVPRAGTLETVVWRSVLSLASNAYISQCSLGISLFLVSLNCWNWKALFLFKCFIQLKSRRITELKRFKNDSFYRDLFR